MITEQERIIRKSQGYDIGFEQSGKKYWINSNEWNEEKEERLFREVGLKTFREVFERENMVLYNPDYFDVSHHVLYYKGSSISQIPQPINMSSGYLMFSATKLEKLDLSDWDASEIANMSSMFLNSKLRQINLAGWDISKAKAMFGIFLGCRCLQEINLAGWNIASIDARTDKIFEQCEHLYNKYNTTDDVELLQKIIEDSNIQQLGQMNVF